MFLSTSLAILVVFSFIVYRYFKYSSSIIERDATKPRRLPTQWLIGIIWTAGLGAFHESIAKLKYPDVQAKIKEELYRHGLTSDAILTPEDLDELVYMECVMKEILRYAPITAGIVRQATRDDVINDIIVKKGDIFLIATQNMHRDPRYWKIDPMKFLPERFLDEDKHPTPYAYMPFGGGHRACIGQDLALFEFKIAITQLMQRITIEDAGNEANNSGGFIQRITCFPKHVAVRVYMDSDAKLPV
ncbi:unnamed protein product [Rotaria sordida]|uniref:Cytochrome P450 n=1 Tax=Rotaria sordida TaxID=392033 RepID=A0A813REU1_9BILA|nr:unnamed protein product [Rotaria sordida]